MSPTETLIQIRLMCSHPLGNPAPLATLMGIKNLVHEALATDETTGQFEPRTASGVMAADGALRAVAGVPQSVAPVPFDAPPALSQHFADGLARGAAEVAAHAGA